LTQYRPVTDGRTDGLTERRTEGIAIASTALATRHAVKNPAACRKRHSVGKLRALLASSVARQEYHDLYLSYGSSLWVGNNVITQRLSCMTRSQSLGNENVYATACQY